MRLDWGTAVAVACAYLERVHVIQRREERAQIRADLVFRDARQKATREALVREIGHDQRDLIAHAHGAEELNHVSLAPAKGTEIEGPRVTAPTSTCAG